jgi:hypothetical protein
MAGNTGAIPGPDFGALLIWKFLNQAFTDKSSCRFSCSWDEEIDENYPPFGEGDWATTIVLAEQRTDEGIPSTDGVDGGIIAIASTPESMSLGAG